MPGVFRPDFPLAQLQAARPRLIASAAAVPTISTVTAATMNYAGQAIVNSAAHVSPVTAATMAYAGQTVATIQARVSAVAFGTMHYGGQAVQTLTGPVMGFMLSRLTELRLFLGL